MTSNNVLVGIVLYNSDVRRLKDVIDNVLINFDNICLFDNGSKNMLLIHEMLDKQYSSKGNLVLLKSKENRGIAFALNRIFEYAKDNAFDWVLTLDHDTVIPCNLKSEYLELCEQGLADVICPNVIDSEIVNNKWEGDSKKRYEPVVRCIQSGNLVNVESWEEVGRYDDQLFVDFVDFDFCKRIELLKKTIYRCNRVVIDHKFGYREKTRFSRVFEKLYKATGLKIFKYFTYENVFSAQRIYYTFRNNVIYIRKYERYLNVRKERMMLLRMFVKRVLRSKNRGMILKQAIKGISDGRKIQIKKFVIDEE